MGLLPRQLPRGGSCCCAAWPATGTHCQPLNQPHQLSTAPPQVVDEEILALLATPVSAKSAKKKNKAAKAPKDAAPEAPAAAEPEAAAA